MVKIYLKLLSRNNIRIRIKADNRYWKDNAIDVIKKLPVIRSYTKNKETSFFTSIHHLDYLFSLAKKNNFEVKITKTLDEQYDRFVLRLQRIANAKQNKEFHSPLWTDDKNCQILPYQAPAINAILAARRYLEGDDMGLGKTAIGIGAMCKAMELDYSKFIIVCLSRLKYQWKSEIMKFTKIPESDISVINLKEKFTCPLEITDKLDLRTEPCKTCDRKNKCKLERDDPDYRWREQIKKGKIFITNYDMINRMKDVIIKMKFDFMILDEATKIKNINADVSKAMHKIIDNMPEQSFVIPMSGTFLENNLLELYSPLRCVDRGIVGEYHNYKNKYLVFDFFGAATGTRNEKLLKKHVDRWIIRRPIESVWKDRPELFELERICEMTEKQRIIYDNARDGKLKDLLENTVEKKINRAEIGALMNYLIQICDTTETMDPNTSESGKIDTLKEMIEEEISKRHKVIIFSFFGNKVVPILKRELKVYSDVLTITGKANAEEAEETKQKFINKSNYRFLVCSDSMAYGANLQCASYVINFDIPWNPAILDQRIRRSYRKGQKQNVNAINLVTKNSIEDKIVEKIGSKRKLFDDILGGRPKSPKMSIQDMLDVLKAK